MKITTEKVLIAFLFCCLLLSGCEVKQSETSSGTVHAPEIFSSEVESAMDADLLSSFYGTAASPTPDPTPAPTPEPELEAEPQLEPEWEPELDSGGTDYIANTNTGKFHYPDCASVDRMREYNKLYFTGDREELIDQGYKPCKRCKP